MSEKPDSQLTSEALRGESRGASAGLWHQEWIAAVEQAERRLLSQVERERRFTFRMASLAIALIVTVGSIFVWMAGGTFEELRRTIEARTQEQLNNIEKSALSHLDSIAQTKIAKEWVVELDQRRTAAAIAYWSIVTRDTRFGADIQRINEADLARITGSLRDPELHPDVFADALQLTEYCCASDDPKTASAAQSALVGLVRDSAVKAAAPDRIHSALYALSRIRVGDESLKLLPLLDDTTLSSGSRALVINALGWTRSAEARHALLRIVDNGEPVERYSCWQALGRIGMDDESLVARINAELAATRSPESRFAMLAVLCSLRRYRDADIGDLLRGCMESRVSLRPILNDWTSPHAYMEWVAESGDPLIHPITAHEWYDRSGDMAKAVATDIHNTSQSRRVERLAQWARLFLMEAGAGGWEMALLIRPTQADMSVVCGTARTRVPLVRNIPLAVIAEGSKIYLLGTSGQFRRAFVFPHEVVDVPASDDLEYAVADTSELYSERRFPPVQWRRYEAN